MNIEYVCSKISSVRWLHGEYLRRGGTTATADVQQQERFWMTGTNNSFGKNYLSIWSNLPNDTSDGLEAGNNLSGIFKVKGIADYWVPAPVLNIVNYDRRSVVVSLTNGDLLWLRFSREEGHFQLMGELTGRKGQGPLAGHHSTGHLVNDYHEVISCGLDGQLRYIDLQQSSAAGSRPAVTRSVRMTANSLHCIDKISPNEVIVGTTSGHLKLFDKRDGPGDKASLLVANDFAVITAVQRNSHLPHIVAAGNDHGLLYLWDLRQGGQRPMAPSAAHSAAITAIRYSATAPNLLFTGSLDGQLIRWNIGNDFELCSVEAIVDKSNPYPITALDIDAATSQLVFADDNEVLYLTKGEPQ